MPIKDNGDTDWNQFFMGLAVAVVFILQAVNQIRIYSNDRDIITIDNNTLSPEEISVKIDKSIQLLLKETVINQEKQYIINKEYFKLRVNSDKDTTN